MNTCPQCILFLYINTFLLTFGYLYVGKNGSDGTSCGVSKEQPCATLYFASTLLNTDNVEINVINGQNEEHIKSYINDTNNAHHPCLPMKLFTNVTITFNEVKINSMLDWYPQICVDYDINNYTHTMNKYMFQAHEIQLTINNLQIDLNQFTHVNFGIINVSNVISPQHPSSFTCNNCIFQNIDNDLNSFQNNTESGNVTQQLFPHNDMNMIYSTRNIKFFNSKFINIK
eukprot:126648_1